jgi:hypothetical protein
MISLAGKPLTLLLRWVARHQGYGAVPASQPVTGEHGEYVAANELINPMVLMSAQADMLKWKESDPQTFQSNLNACMETLESEPTRTRLMVFVGHLIANGRKPEDAMIRSMANILLLGIVLERRLKRADEQLPVKFGPDLTFGGPCSICGLPVFDHISPNAGGGSYPHSFRAQP